MSPNSRLEKNFAAAVVGQMDRSYFPSTLLYIETENPGARGQERDWAVFLNGAENGAKASFERLQPVIEQAEATFLKVYESVERALEISEDLDVPALEALLAARNATTEYTQLAWKRFHSALTDWASGTLGLQTERLRADDEDQALSLAFSLMQLLQQGTYHPFFAWAIATYKDKKDVKIHDLRPLSIEYLRVPPKPRDMLAFMEQVSAASAVKQYLKWARLEYQEIKQKVTVKSQGLVLPNAEFSEWIAKDLLNEGDDDDDDE